MIGCPHVQTKAAANYTTGSVMFVLIDGQRIYDEKWDKYSRLIKIKTSEIKYKIATIHTFCLCES